MALNPEAYVDTSAFIAFLDRSDSYHDVFARLFSDPPRLITTPLVVSEGQAWFLRRFDQNRALQFLAFVDDLKPIKMLSTSSKEVAAATKVIRRFPDQELTMADALGLHLMEQRGISSCWSTDFHLGLNGVRLVIHEN